MNVKIQTIKNIRLLLARELKPVYPPEEVNSLTNIILKTCLNTDWLHHLTEPDRLVEENVVKRIISITGELKTGKPIQYILGETEFYNCRLKLNNNTLIPRQETEELVDLIIRENHGYKGNILDIGTGSGCIAIALARNIPGSEITAIDNSLEALKIAEQNAMLNNVSIEFRNIDIMDTEQNHMLADFGIIVSNPPYVLESYSISNLPMLFLSLMTIRLSITGKYWNYRIFYSNPEEGSILRLMNPWVAHSATSCRRLPSLTLRL
jgi:release factor glutamine methyltransferase